MIQILKQPDRDFTINMLETLREKVDNSHEQMGNFSREVESPRKSQMKMLKKKKTRKGKNKNKKNHDIRDEDFL